MLERLNKLCPMQKLPRLNCIVGLKLRELQASHNAIANGNSSVAAINSDVTVGQNVLLEEKVKHLEELLAEKERLIKVLMEKK